MKLDVNSLRYLSKEEWRVLGSVELGQRNVRHASNSVPWADTYDSQTRITLFVTAARDGAEGADSHNRKPKVSVVAQRQLEKRLLCLY